MRMLILSYFTVAGTVLFGLLFWASAEIAPNGPPIPVSQTVGIPAPFKAHPEQLQYTITGSNFAAEYGEATTNPANIEDVLKPAKSENSSRQRKTTGKNSKSQWNRLAESPREKSERPIELQN